MLNIHRKHRIFSLTLFIISLFLLSCGDQPPATNTGQYGDLNYIAGITEFQGEIWCATKGGIVSWNINDETHSIITTADGLPSNVLNDIVQIDDEMLWIATVNGLCVYDGEFLTVYDVGDGLPSNEVTSLTVNGQGDLWIGTTEGIASFDGSGFTVIDAPDGPGDAYIQTVSFDMGQNLWVGTEADGIYFLSEEGWTHTTTRDGLLANSARVVAQAWDRSVWSASWAGISRWDGNSWKSFSARKVLGTYNVWDMITTDKLFWYFTDMGVHVSQGSDWSHYTEEDGLISDDTLCGYIVSDDLAYVGTVDGMSVIANGQIQNYFIPNCPVGYNYLTIEKDSRNRMWLGTWETGVNLFDSEYWTKVLSKHGTTLETVRDIVFGPDGQIVFNTPDGVLFEKDNEWRLHTRRNGVAGNDVRCGVFDDQGRYLVGTDTGISLFDNGRWQRFRQIHGLPSEDVWSCARGADGVIWFGTTAGIVSFTSDGFVDRTPETGLDTVDVRSIAAVDGRMLFGTQSGRVLEYSGGQWDEYGNNWSGSESGIHAIFADPQGTVWLGTEGSGLIGIRDGGNVKYTREDGLPSNFIRDIAWRDGVLWMACFGGVGTVDVAAE